MTWALCFNCGNVKFGAICPCPKCSVASTGNIGLDIAFSDHRLAVESLNGFGEVVAALQENCPDAQLRFWAFLHYISENYPAILRVDLKPELRQQAEELLATLVLPAVQVLPPR